MVAVHVAQNKAHLGAQAARALGISGPAIEEQELLGQQQLSEDLHENSEKCAEEHKKMHDSVEAYIVRDGSEPKQPDKEEPQEIKK